MKLLRLLFILTTLPLLAQERLVVINECMPNNTNTAMDQDGEYNDWLELYNIGESSINLQGYFLSDRRSAPTKYTFPNVSLAANDYLIVWVDKDSTQAGLHTNFKLSASSEQVYLFNPDTNLIDYVHFYNMQPDESIARTVDGNGPFEVTSPTYNSSNGNNPAGVVINEWMAWNASEEMDEYGEYNDWIELYNNSNQAINLNGYFLSNKANEATKYQFPSINIGAQQYLVLWADQDSLQGDLHLPFKLDSERDDIVLARPDTSTIDYFFHHNVDSNTTQARIPNGIGNIVVGSSTIQAANQEWISVKEFEYHQVSIIPNPSTGVFELKRESTIKENLQLYSASGILIKEVVLNNRREQINIEHLPPGTYFIRSSSIPMTPIVVN